MPTVLIGFAEAISAPEVAWSLIDAGYSVVAFTRRGCKPALRKCARVRLVEISLPDTDWEAAVRDIVKISRDISPSVIMPLDDVSVFLCDQAAGQLQCLLVGPVGACAAMALDKRLQIALATEAGFAVPKTTIYASIDSVPDAQSYPIVVKPALAVVVRDGKVSQFGCSICAGETELKRAKSRWPAGMPVLLQPFIAGVGEGLFGIADKSGVHALSGHQRLRMMNPQGSGSSACRSIRVDPALSECAARMLKQSGWHGMFMVELLRDEAGRVWFMEFNGRPWGSMALARRAGYEYPAWAVRMSMDLVFRPPAPSTYKAITCRHLGRELVHVLMVLRGPKSEALTKWPSRWRTLREVVALRRGERWYNWRRGNPGVFVTDTIQTVRGKLQPARRMT